MSAITVYSAPGCKQCRATKKHLERRGVAYNEIDISANDEAREFIANQGFQQVPVVDLGDGNLFYGFRPERIDAVAKELSVA